MVDITPHTVLQCERKEDRQMTFGDENWQDWFDYELQKQLEPLEE